jgi:hypothetical protein
MVDRAPPEDAAELPEPEPPELPVDDELPHAAITSVAAIAPTGTSHLFRMTHVSVRMKSIGYPFHVAQGRFVHERFTNAGARPLASRRSRASARLRRRQAELAADDRDRLLDRHVDRLELLLAGVQLGHDREDAAAMVMLARAWLTQYRNWAIRSPGEAG